MPSKQKITKSGKPTQKQLNEWYESQSEVSFKEKDGSVHNGIILSLNAFAAEDALLFIKDSRYGVYHRDITSFTYTDYPEFEPVFLEKDNTTDAGITLVAEGKEFYVSRRVLCERLEYFRAMFQCSMRESITNRVDLSDLLSVQELEALLLFINDGSCKNLSTEQALHLTGAADKVLCLDENIISSAKNKIIENITIDEYASLKEQLDWMHPIMQNFVLNIRSEIKDWFRKSSSTSIVATTLAQLNCSNRVNNPIALTLICETFPYESSKKAKKIQLSGEEMARVITLLELSGCKIEQLFLLNISFSELQPVLECLIGNKNIKSLVTKWNSISMNQPKNTLKDINLLLTFINAADSLNTIHIGTAKFSKEASKAIADAQIKMASRIANQTTKLTLFSSNEAQSNSVPEEQKKHDYQN